METNTVIYVAMISAFCVPFVAIFMVRLAKVMPRILLDSVLDYIEAVRNIMWKSYALTLKK